MHSMELYWKMFYDRDQARFDGLTFEDLVEELLLLLYGKKWTRTGKTHDGNRDFYLNANNETLWAECKNYKDTIALKTLAPTLVMAQVCDANTIIFFSRSNINHSAKEKITAYGYKSAKKVIFYDGRLLENIIIKYNRKLSKKYQIPMHLLKNIKDVEQSITVSEFYFPSTLSKMVTTWNDYINYQDTECLHYNELFSILLTITNSSSKDSKVQIVFDESNEDRYCYEYLSDYVSSDSNLVEEFELKSGESRACSLNLRTIIFKKKLFLPRFHVICLFSDSQSFEWRSDRVEVDCKWVGNTKLLGAHYNKIIERVEEKLVNNSELSAFLLTGNSGTGKSRILRECYCPLLKNGYKILQLNVTEKSSTENLLKEIIYFLYEIPAELILQIITEQIESDFCKDVPFDTELLLNIAEMIKSINSDIKTFMTLYKDLLFENLAQKKLAIIIDNMQFAPQHFQEFWCYYIDFSVNQQRANKSIFITSFNSDYITEICAKTIYILQNSNIPHLIDESISGFKENSQGVLFMRELLRVKDDYYDSFFVEIIESVSLNPFNLYQMVKLLEEDEIIRYSSGQQGYLLPTEATWKTTWKVPKDINDVLKRRFEYINSKIEITSLYLILSSCYLLEVIDGTIISLFGLNRTDIDFLVEHQILFNNGEEYSFFHDIIRKFFENNYSDNRLYCLGKIKNVEDVLSYGVLYNLYKICIMKDEKLISKMCQTRNLSGVPVRIQGVFLEFLFEHNIKQTIDEKKISSWLEKMCWICSNIRNTMGSIKAMLYYKRVFDYVDSVFHEFSNICCIQLRRLLHSLCDIYIQIHQRPNAITFAQQVINKLSNEPTNRALLLEEHFTETQDEYYVLKAIMFNRVFCAYNNAFPTDEINRKRNEALENSRLLIPKIKNEYKRNLIAYLNDSDDGYRYFGFQTDYEKLMLIWEKCLVNIPILAPEKTMNYYRKQVQCQLIRKNHEMAKKYIAEGREYLGAGEHAHEPLIFNTFFTMAEIVDNLQHNPKETYLYTEKLLGDLTKLQLLLRSNKMEDIYLLQGINAFYANDLQTVYYALKKAYLAYNEKETSYYWVKRELVRETIITAFGILKMDENRYDISFLTQECREQLLSFSPNHFRAKGIIQTQDGLFNLPLLV